MSDVNNKGLRTLDEIRASRAQCGDLNQVTSTTPPDNYETLCTEPQAATTRADTARAGGAR